MASPRAIRYARAFVEFFADDSKLQRGLKMAQVKLRAFAAGTAKIGQGLIAAGAAVASPFVLAVSAASRLQETMNKFNVVFGDNSEAMKQWGDEFASQVGRSKEQVASFLASTQDLLVPAGIDPKAAEQMSKDLTALAVDVASFNNKADDDVLRDFHAALTGGGETVKKYGVILNVASTNAELLRQGINPKEATDAQKVQARLAVLMQGTTAAQGDAIRSADSWANMQKRVRAQLDDVAASIGEAVLPTLTMLLGHVSRYIDVAGAWIAENQDIVRTVGMVAVGLIAGGAALLAISGAATVASVALGGLSIAAGVLFSPLGLLVALGAALGVVLVKSAGGATQALEWLQETFKPLTSRATEAFGSIRDALNAGDYALAARVLWLALKEAWYSGIAPLREAWVGFGQVFTQTMDDAFVSIARKWVELQGWLSRQFVELMGFFDSSLNVEDIQRTLTEDIEQRINRIDVGAEARSIEREAETSAAMAAIRQDIEAARSALTEARNEARLAAEAADLAAPKDGEQNRFAELLSGVQIENITAQTATIAAAPTSGGDLRSVSGFQNVLQLINRERDLTAREVRNLRGDVTLLRQEFMRWPQGARV